MKSNATYKRRLGHLALGATLACAVIATGRASAEVADQAPNGFTVRETVHIAAASDKVYAALIAPQRWWSPHHTFSGDAANLTFDAKAGGCWCETLPNGGSVQHMTIVYVLPGKALRLRGAMGPMQSMAVEDVMDWSLKPAGTGTDVTLTGAIGGYANSGVDKLAPIVDHVFGEQVARLKTYVETGSTPSP
jgi:uncharacterized protein YndB with AHSA1/START domain